MTASGTGGADEADGTTRRDGGGLDRSAATTSYAISMVAALLVVLALSDPMASLPAVAGAALVGLGGWRRSPTLVSRGAVLLGSGIVIAGLRGASSPAILVATVFACLAWDGGRYGIAIGEQLGADARTRPVELAHAGTTLAIGATGAGLGYGAYRTVSSGQPVLALACLLAGALLLTFALSRERLDESATAARSR